MATAVRRQPGSGGTVFEPGWFRVHGDWCDAAGLPVSGRTSGGHRVADRRMVPAFGYQLTGSIRGLRFRKAIGKLSPAVSTPIFCWPVPWRGSERSRCGSRWALRQPVSCANCWRKAWCWRRSEGQPGCRWRTLGCGFRSPSGPRAWCAITTFNWTGLYCSRPPLCWRLRFWPDCLRRGAFCGRRLAARARRRTRADGRAPCRPRRAGSWASGVGAGPVGWIGTADPQFSEVAGREPRLQSPQSGYGFDPVAGRRAHAGAAHASIEPRGSGCRGAGAADVAAMSRLPLLGRSLGSWVFVEGKSVPGAPTSDIDTEWRRPTFPHDGNSVAGRKTL
jgi:hypothetical protein